MDPSKDKRFIAYVDQDKARFDPNGLRFESQFNDWTRLATNPNVADAIRYGSYTAYQRRDPMYFVHEQQAFRELLEQAHDTLALNKGCTVAELTPDETRWWLTSQDAMPPDVYSQGYPRLYVDGRYGFLRPHLRGEYGLMVAALEREHQIPPEHSANNPDLADSLLTLKQWNELTHFLARLTLKWLDHGSVGKPELKIFPSLQKITADLRNYANPFFSMLEVLKNEFEVFATSDILMLAQQFDKCIFNGTTPVHTYVLAMLNFRETALKYTPSVELVEQHFSIDRIQSKVFLALATYLKDHAADFGTDGYYRDLVYWAEIIHGRHGPEVSTSEVWIARSTDIQAFYQWTLQHWVQCSTDHPELDPETPMEWIPAMRGTPSEVNQGLKRSGDTQLAMLPKRPRERVMFLENLLLSISDDVKVHKPKLKGRGLRDFNDRKAPVNPASTSYYRTSYNTSRQSFDQPSHTGRVQNQPLRLTSRIQANVARLKHVLGKLKQNADSGVSPTVVDVALRLTESLMLMCNNSAVNHTEEELHSLTESVFVIKDSLDSVYESTHSDDHPVAVSTTLDVAQSDDRSQQDEPISTALVPVDPDTQGEVAEPEQQLTIKERYAAHNMIESNSKSEVCYFAVDDYLMRSIHGLTGQEERLFLHQAILKAKLPPTIIQVYVDSCASSGMSTSEVFIIGGERLCGTGQGHSRR